MKVEKRVTENITWAMDEYCCEKMEHALCDEFLFICEGQTQIQTVFHYLKEGHYIDFCPFCGEKIESGVGDNNV